MTIRFFIVVILIASARVVFSQGDTIDNRMVSCHLSDRTELLYSIGSLKLKQAGNFRYLRFTDRKDTTNVDVLFRSADFTISGGTDTLSFFRYAVFRDTSRFVVRTLSPGSSEFDHVMTSAMKKHPLGSGIVPNSLSFAPNSWVKCIIEIRDASDNAVLQILDTLKMYRNAEGMLRYQNYPSSRCLVNLPIGGIPSMTVAYLSVRREVPFWLTSDDIRYQFVGSSTNAPMDRDVTIGALEEEGLPQRVVLLTASPYGQMSFIPDCTGNDIHLSVASFGVDDVVISLYNMDFEKVYSEPRSLVSGRNELKIHLPSLHSGTYVMEIRGRNGMNYDPMFFNTTK